MMTLMKRKRRKCGKLRGKRRHGHGNIKNRRGAGNRGGRGNAGLHKHKYTYTVVYAKDHFGKHGFVNPTRKELPTLNLYEIEAMIEKGQLAQQEGKYVFEFNGKILGCGTISSPVLVRARAWSKKAEEKIKAAGGEIEELLSPAQSSGEVASGEDENPG